MHRTDVILIEANLRCAIEVSRSTTNIRSSSTYQVVVLDELYKMHVSVVHGLFDRRQLRSIYSQFLTLVFRKKENKHKLDAHGCPVLVVPAISLIVKMDHS